MLDLGQWISEVRNSSDWDKIAPRLGPMFEAIETAINQTAKSAGVDSTGHLQAPDPPSALNIKAASNGEQVHITIADNTSRDRTLNYFVEHSTSPVFSPASTWTTHLGVSRHHIMTLPTYPDAGGTKINYYFRTYSMSPGSEKPSPHVYFGQSMAPTAVTMNGATQLTLQTSTGAGTSPSNGQRAGKGFGIAQVSDEKAGRAL
jgi:hypothetical protein